jgi:transcription elongation factor GreA
MPKLYRPKPAPIPFTESGYKNVLDEQAKLLAERPDAVEHLRKAREMGDLSENGYYKAAKQRLVFLDARLRRIERLVKQGVIVKPAGTGKIDIGSTVTISDGTREFTYEIVGGYESDPSRHTISYISPIGKALMGHTSGETVQATVPSGLKQYSIKTVS